MSDVAGNERHVVLCSGCSNDGITGSHTGRNGIFFEVEVYESPRLMLSDRGSTTKSRGDRKSLM